MTGNKCKSFIVDYYSLPESALNVNEKSNRYDLYKEMTRYGFVRRENGKIEKGDVIIFRLPGEWHVGMCLMKNKFKHYLPKKGMIVSRLDNRLWKTLTDSVWGKESDG